MRIVAFAGPSLGEADRRSFSDVEWHPPAEGGDLLRLLPHPPDRICLLDGFFDHRAAVRHTEILWLLGRGIRIYGAASIGALRAAEMDRFGIIGVGAIYRAYARGSLTGDDEVALIHAPAEHDWRPLSLPLVNVRATLCRALRLRVVNVADARLILASAAALHYVDRCWGNVLTKPTCRGMNSFRAWVNDGAVDQKRLDGRACVEFAVADDTASFRPVTPVRTAFLNALAEDCGIEL